LAGTADGISALFTCMGTVVLANYDL